MGIVYRKTVFKTARLAKYESGVFVIALKFPFGKDVLTQVKSIPDRVFHAEF